MLALDPAHGAGRCPHHDALGGHGAVLVHLDARQQRAVSHASRGEDAVTLGKLDQIVLLVEVLNAPLAGAGLLIVVAEQQAALELTADATQRSSSQLLLLPTTAM